MTFYISPFWFISLSLFWFVRETKSILFWLYLWQLKEYHLGRFIDHFRTEKGKKILFNKLLFFKVILILLSLFFAKFEYVTIKPWLNYYAWIIHTGIPAWILYIAETAKGVFDFGQRKLKTPVFTKKISFLFFLVFSFQIFYFFSILDFDLLSFSISLLIFDVFTPAIVSSIVLIFQPLTVFWRNSLIKKAKEKRQKFKKLIVVGITGSYGKTSTKEFLAKILSEKYKVLKTKEHQNSEVGISQCILNDLKPEHEVFIVEMGAYNRGGIKLLCDIAKPQIGIVTGVNEQHLSTFGSMENLLSAEGGEELIDSLPPLGFAVFNGDNKYCRDLYKKTRLSKRICYTKFLAPADEVVEGDYWAKEIKINKDTLSFKVFSQRWGDIAEFKVNLPGEHFAQNILMAAVVAKEIMGMSLKEIAQACQKIKPEQGGMKIIKTKDGLNIIDSTYSANPDGVIAHLNYLKNWEGKKAIVMPCLIELGSASRKIHRKIGEKIGEVCDLAIITTKERFRDLKEGAIKSGMAKEKILFLENPKEIFEKIKTFWQPDDIVLLEGRIPKEVVELLTL